MFKFVKKLQAARNFVRLVNEPTRLDEVFNLSDKTGAHEVLTRLAANLEKTPKGAKALEARRALPRADLKELSKLPEGTLGRAFADFLIVRGLDPTGIPVVSSKDKAEFVRAHLYDTHDIWHVVTGFDTDVAGELGLQGFYMAQIHGPLPPTILAAGMLNTAFHDTGDSDARMRNIVVGWRTGKRAEPFFGTDWDLYWDMPLEEVRRMHGIDPRGVQPELDLEASIMTGARGFVAAQMLEPQAS